MNTHSGNMRRLKNGHKYVHYPLGENKYAKDYITDSNYNVILRIDAKDHKELEDFLALYETDID